MIANNFQVIGYADVTNVPLCKVASLVMHSNTLSPKSSNDLQSTEDKIGQISKKRGFLQAEAFLPVHGVISFLIKTGRNESRF